MPKTNFAVTFALVRQSPTKKGKAVFTKVIERIGPETVAVLNIVLGGKPLLSHRKADFKKEPTQFHPITGGWYVEANSSIAAK